MSANNQVLIANKGDKWYVFPNVMAEAWGQKEGEEKWEEGTVHLHIGNRQAFNREIDAFVYAKEEGLDQETEYGIGINKLVKDGTRVILK